MTEKAATKIEQLEQQIKDIKSAEKDRARKERTKRLCQRMGHIESILPDTINLTEEQFHAFIKRTLQNDHARKILTQARTQATPQNTAKSPQNEPQQRQSAAPLDGGGVARSGVK